MHEIGDMLTAIPEKKSVGPDFYDGCRGQQVLDVASRSLQRIQLVGKVKCDYNDASCYDTLLQ